MTEPARVDEAAVLDEELDAVVDEFFVRWACGRRFPWRRTCRSSPPGLDVDAEAFFLELGFADNFGHVLGGVFGEAYGGEVGDCGHGGQSRR